MYFGKTSKQIAVENDTTQGQINFITNKYGIPASNVVGKVRLYDMSREAQIVEHIDRINRKHLKTQPPAKPSHIESFFIVADHARELGVSPARVDQAIKALGITQTQEFNGERAYRAELSNAVGRLALSLARQAGEAITPDRSDQAANWDDYVSSLEGVALTTKKPLHEVTAAARAIGAKSVRVHADGRELFDEGTTQEILNELTRRNKAAGNVGQDTAKAA